MEQQSAVEWFFGQMPKKLHSHYKKQLEQAKEMEKEQIVEAFYQGVDQESDTHGAMNLDRKDAENYYNETFKTK